MSEASTPLMRQHAAIKKEHPTALLFFRVGDFYELFFDDAVTAARELQITLTSRQKVDGVALPMCGVPYHAAEGYIAKLIRKGYKVAICDQVEDPKLTKKLVRREVTRVVTPGTAADSQLGSEENNFLCAVARHADSESPLASPRSISPPANSAPPNSAAPTPTAAWPTSCKPCVRASCSTPLAAAVPIDRCPTSAAVSNVGEALAPAAAATPLSEQPPFIATPAPRLASTDLAPFARWSETPLDDWIFATDYAIPLVENHFGVLRWRASASPITTPPPAPPEPSSTMFARPARRARPRRPHRLLRAPELPDP